MNKQGTKFEYVTKGTKLWSFEIGTCVVRDTDTWGFRVKNVMDEERYYDYDGFLLCEPYCDLTDNRFPTIFWSTPEFKEDKDPFSLEQILKKLKPINYRFDNYNYTIGYDDIHKKIVSVPVPYVDGITYYTYDSIVQVIKDINDREIDFTRVQNELKRLSESIDK